MARRHIRKTKVVATIGPSSDSPDVLKAMIRAGMDVARLNFSHGSHEEHRKRLECIRNASAELGANVAVMLDTKGMKIRTGRLASGFVTLETDAAFSLFTDGRVGDVHGVAVSYPALPEDVRPGSRILIDDGAIELEVLRVAPAEIACRIRRGGRLQERKGVNLPGAALGIAAMSPEDRADLAFAVHEDIDYVAASFMRGSADVREVRSVLREHGGGRIPIIAKIESASGVQRLDEIVAEADGIMVARGDLGVELPLQEVPTVQKKIIRATVMNGKPVITATQMLDSMQRNPTPTRAEVSDVANAIFDGTSAVMLSNETAVGAYPVEAVRTMATLALEAEASLAEYGHLQQILPEPSNVVTDAVSQAAITMATHLNAAAIVALTESGLTARAISKYRPRSPILGVTRWERVMRRFAMNWGVIGVRFEGSEPTDSAMTAFAIRRARELGIAEPGDVVVVTAGVSREAGTTSMIRVVTVDAEAT